MSIHEFLLKFVILYSYWSFNRIDGVMANVFASSVVDLGFERRKGNSKDYNICICFFSAKHATLRSKNKNRLAQNQDHLSEWRHMSTCGLFCQSANTIEIQHNHSHHHHHHRKLTCSRYNVAETFLIWC